MISSDRILFGSVFPSVEILEEILVVRLNLFSKPYGGFTKRYCVVEYLLRWLSTYRKCPVEKFLQLIFVLKLLLLLLQVKM